MIVTSTTPIDDLSVTTTPAATTSETAPAPETTAPPTDTVTLSEETTAHRLLMTLDQDGDGSVSKDDFVKSGLDLLRKAGRFEALTANAKRAAKHEAAWTRKFERKFERADANHDGSIGESEISAMMSSESKHHAARSMAEPTKVRMMTAFSVAKALDSYRTATPAPTPDPAPPPADASIES